MPETSTLTADALLPEVKEYLASISAAHGEPPPSFDDGVMTEILRGLLERDSPVGETAVPYSAGSHKFSSTQFDLDADIAKGIEGMASRIPDDLLAGDGREDEPHITCLYGLHTDDAEDVRKVVEDFGPVKVKLGKTSIFPANEASAQRGGEQYDVVKIDVESEDLHRLHGLLAGALEHTDTHPRYKPHVTLAYVKAGEGEQFVGMDDVEGYTLTLADLIFSPADGQWTSIPLVDDEEMAVAYALQPGERYASHQPGPEWTYAGRGKRGGKKWRRSRPARQSLGGEALAGHISAWWNLNGEPSESDMDAAAAELDGTGWGVWKDEEEGEWAAVDMADAGDDLPEDALVVYAAERAPKGGVVINGKQYRGGMWIPSSALASASPEVKARISAAAGEHKERVRGRMATMAHVREKTAPHADIPLTPGQQTQAKQMLAQLISHHGEHVVSRLDELAEQATAMLAKIDEEHPNEVMQRQLRTRLAQLHAATDMVEKKGHGSDYEKAAKAHHAGKESLAAGGERMVLDGKSVYVKTPKGWVLEKDPSIVASDATMERWKGKGRAKAEGEAQEHGQPAPEAIQPPPAASVAGESRPAKKSKKFRKYPTSKAKEGDTLYSIIKAGGGINVDQLRQSYNVKEEFIESGLMGLLRNPKKNPNVSGLDQWAETLHRQGHINVPENETPQDYLLGQLHEHALSLHANIDDDVEKQAKAFYESKERADAEQAAGPGETDTSTEGLVRAGEEAGETEASEGDAWEGAGELANEEGAGEGGGGIGDFEFGMNAPEAAEQAPEGAPAEAETGAGNGEPTESPADERRRLNDEHERLEHVELFNAKSRLRAAQKAASALQDEVSKYTDAAGNAERSGDEKQAAVFREAAKKAKGKQQKQDSAVTDATANVAEVEKQIATVTSRKEELYPVGSQGAKWNDIRLDPNTGKPRADEEHERRGVQLRREHRERANAPEAEEKQAATAPADTNAALSSIPIGDLARVNGVMVRRTGENDYRVETDAGQFNTAGQTADERQAGVVRGDAAKIAEHIKSVSAGDKMYGRQRDEALSRVEGVEEPSFMDADGMERARAGFNRLPIGAKVVSLEDATKGRVGSIVTDADGKRRVKFEGEEGYGSPYVEPLDQRQSWRVPHEKEEGPKQGGMFDTEPDGEVGETSPPESDATSQELFDPDSDPEHQPPVKPGKESVKTSDVFTIAREQPDLITQYKAVEDLAATAKPSQVHDIPISWLAEMGDENGPFQTEINKKVAEHYRDNPNHAPVVVIREDGKDFILEGRHRALGAKLRGSDTVRAVVIEKGPDGKPVIVPPAAAPGETGVSAGQPDAGKQPHEMTADEFERSKQGDTYGDWYFTPDGKYVQMRGSGGMGSNRVGAVDVNGKMVGWYDRDQLRLAKKSERASTATDAADAWLANVSGKVAALKKDNEGLLLNKGVTDTFRNSLKSGKMTQEQFDKAKAKGTILSDADYAKAEAVERQIEDARNTPLTVPENSEHRAAVQAALSSGKPVPQEVMKDYPELAKEPQSPAPVSSPSPAHIDAAISEASAEADRLNEEDGGYPSAADDPLVKKLKAAKGAIAAKDEKALASLLADPEVAAAIGTKAAPADDLSRYKEYSDAIDELDRLEGGYGKHSFEEWKKSGANAPERREDIQKRLALARSSKAKRDEEFAADKALGDFAKVGDEVYHRVKGRNAPEWKPVHGYGLPLSHEAMLAKQKAGGAKPVTNEDAAKHIEGIVQKIKDAADGKTRAKLDAIEAQARKEVQATRDAAQPIGGTGPPPGGWKPEDKVPINEEDVRHRTAELAGHKPWEHTRTEWMEKAGGNVGYNYDSAVRKAISAGDKVPDAVLDQGDGSFRVYKQIVDIDKKYTPKQRELLKKKTHEMTEEEYLDQQAVKTKRDAEHQIVYKQREIDKIGPKATKKKEELEGHLAYWKKAAEKPAEQSDALKETSRRKYRETIKEAISKGLVTDSAIIGQHPEFQLARTARERYEKGLHTSFANKSIAVDSTMKAKRGYKAKQQDGKELSPTNKEELDRGVGEIEAVLGPMKDLFDFTDVTLAHTNGKHPFLSTAGGMYSPDDRTVTSGTAIASPFGIYKCKALAHEIGHWLDFEAGKALGFAGSATHFSIKGRTGRRCSTTAISDMNEQMKHDNPEKSELLRMATDTINKKQEAKKLAGGIASKAASEEEKLKTQAAKVELGPYWTSAIEVWARLFEQYIGDHHGMKAENVSHKHDYFTKPGYWDEQTWQRLKPLVKKEIDRRVTALRNAAIQKAGKS